MAALWFPNNVSDLDPASRLILAPYPASGYFLNMLFYNLTVPFSMSREVPILIEKLVLTKWIHEKLYNFIKA
jgi:hypothetical protein